MGAVGDPSEETTGSSDVDPEAEGESWDGDPTSVETDYPYTGTPEIVDMDERGGAVTLRTVSCHHAILGADAAGGPRELPEVWARQAGDANPSVPGPVLRATEGSELEVTYENDHDRPHTFHVHALNKSWMDDGAPATTG